MKMGLKTKFILFISLLLISLSAAFTAINIRSNQDTIRQRLAEKARGMASLLGASVSDPLYLLQIEDLRFLLSDVLEQDEVVYAYVFDEEGSVVTDGSGDNPFRFQVLNDDISRKAVAAEATLVQFGQDVLDVTEPLYLKNKKLGGVRIGFSLAKVQQEIIDVRNRNILLGVGFVVAGIVLTLILVLTITRPLGLLIERTEAVSRGELDRQIELRTGDELHVLSESFNKMTKNLSLSREAIVSAKAYTDNILSSMNETLIVISAEGEVQTVNAAVCDLLGYREEELVGRPVTKIFTEETKAFFDEVVLNDLTQNSTVRNVEKTCLTKKGKEIPVLFSGAVMHQDAGEVFGFVCVIQDISERKQMEEALWRAHAELEQRVRERTAELQEANESLQREIGEREKLEEQLRQSQKLEAIGRLAGGVAHDFNNQLAIIRGYVDIVYDELPKDARVHDLLGHIGSAVQRSASLTEQLLMFSSKQPVNMRPLDLNRHVRDIQKMLGRLLGEDIVVEMELEEDLWTVSADAGNMDQVITNLCVNARDAMPSGGTLTVRTQNMPIDDSYCHHVPDARPGRFTCVSVSDTGVGMDEEVLSRLFEPFFTTKGPGKGTGLGLSVVYGIVQTHEGWVTVESELNKGSCLSVYLPAVDEEVERLDYPMSSVSLNQFRGGGERVLLVEDEPALRDMTQQALTGKGYAVYVCSTATEAAQAFRNEAHPFDLVLSDVVLPDGRGTDIAFEFLKEQPDLPVILMTGYTDERADWERVREAGLVLLQKPFPMAVLLTQVQDALKNRKAP